MVGICKTEVGDSLNLLLGELAALGLCQPRDVRGHPSNLRERPAEMTEVGEVVCVDPLATRVQRPGGWANQKVLYDAKRRTHVRLTFENGFQLRQDVNRAERTKRIRLRDPQQRVPQPRPMDAPLRPDTTCSAVLALP
jgi:hypothetical protein